MSSIYVLQLLTVSIIGIFNIQVLRLLIFLSNLKISPDPYEYGSRIPWWPQPTGFETLLKMLTYSYIARGSLRARYFATGELSSPVNKQFPKFPTDSPWPDRM
jgi:hypothetical protein